jgi:predicted N-formylglutamate amidohydrolase
VKLLLTAEHAGSAIPKKYLPFFKGAEATLKSHHGFDIGSLSLFNSLKQQADYTKKNEISRLLIEFNRSTNHRNLFSKYALPLSLLDKKELLMTLYQPYRSELINYIQSVINTGESILHISVHSFTPVLNGHTRNADIGLLYDPRRNFERQLARHWKKQLVEINPHLKIRFNYPYLGKADGLTTFMRKVFPHNYAGIELEVNQAHCESQVFPAWLVNQISQSLRALRQDWEAR